MSLVARTRRLDHDVDLLAVAGVDGVLLARDGVGLAGRGTALEIEVDDVAGGPGRTGRHRGRRRGRRSWHRRGRLRGLAVPTRPHPGACASPRSSSAATTEGSRWVTTVGDIDPNPVLLDTGEPGPLPDRVTVETTQSAEDWCAAVVDGREAVRAGDLRKVVLARELVVTTDRPIDRRGVLRRLAAAFPGCSLAAVDGFVCASPETLVARHGDVVRSHPMAGHGPPRWRSHRRRPTGRGPAGLGQGPGRAPGHHRLRPRDPAALVLLPRRGGRALGRRRGQRPAPRDPGRGPSVRPRPVGPGAGARPCTPPRRSAGTPGRPPSP